MPRIVLHLGAGELMVHSIRILRQAGFTVYAIDRDPHAVGFRHADHAAVVDIIDVDAVTAYAREVRADVILAVSDAGVVSAAVASQRLGLRNLPPDVAERCVDKFLMRQAWKAAGLPQPDFRLARNAAEIADAATALGYPLVIKPAMNWGSRGVSYVESEHQLEWSIQFAIQNSRNPRFIVEKALGGTEMTVEGLVLDGKVQVLAKSDKVAQLHPRFRVAMALNYPANFKPWQLLMADKVVADAAVALGITNSAFHCECMVSDNGVFLVELGARGGGGHIFGTIVEAVSGVCMPLSLVSILSGEQPVITPLYEKGSCYRFFSPPHGIFQSVSGIDDARRSRGILDLGFAMKPGTVVNDISGDADRPGFIVSSGEDRAEAIANAGEALSKIRFNMQ
jgi:biotin carboxylase